MHFLCCLGPIFKKTSLQLKCDVLPEWQQIKIQLGSSYLFACEIAHCQYCTRVISLFWSLHWSCAQKEAWQMYIYIKGINHPWHFPPDSPSPPSPQGTSVRAALISQGGWYNDLSEKVLICSQTTQPWTIFHQYHRSANLTFKPENLASFTSWTSHWSQLAICHCTHYLKGAKKKYFVFAWIHLN